MVGNYGGAGFRQQAGLGSLACHAARGLATTVTLVIVGCNLDGARPAARGVPPPTVIAPGAKVTVGFALGQTRKSQQIAGFGITKTPITVRQFKDCIAAGACTLPAITSGACAAGTTPPVLGMTFATGSSADNLPVTCVSPNKPPPIVLGRAAPSRR